MSISTDYQQFVNTRWSQFVASSVNNEAKVVHAARLERRRRILEEQRAPLQPPPVSQQPQERRAPLRAETALQLFRYDMMGRDRDLGLKFNPCSAAHWAKSTEEFAFKFVIFHFYHCNFSSATRFLRVISYLFSQFAV